MKLHDFQRDALFNLRAIASYFEEKLNDGRVMLRSEEINDFALFREELNKEIVRIETADSKFREFSARRNKANPE